MFFTVAVNVFFIVETSKRLNYEDSGASRGVPSEPGLLKFGKKCRANTRQHLLPTEPKREG